MLSNVAPRSTEMCLSRIDGGQKLLKISMLKVPGFGHPCGKIANEARGQRLPLEGPISLSQQATPI